MKQKVRQLNIIRQLLVLNDYTTIDQLALTLKVSNRTCRNDLEQLSDILKKNNLTLIKKTGMGIKIEGHQQDKLHLLKTTKTNLNAVVSLNKQERISYIILRILSCDHVRILDLIKELYISRSTIQKDLEDVNTLCQQYHVTFIKEGLLGLKITGKERYIRNLMFDLMIEDPTAVKFNQLLQNLKTPLSGDFIFLGLDITDDEIHSYLKTIKTETTGFSLNALSHYIIRLLLSSIRINLHHEVTLSQGFMDELAQDTISYQDTLKLLDCWPLVNRLKYSNHEIHYLQIYYIAYQQGYIYTSPASQKIIQITHQVIEYLSRHSVYNFKDDSQLQEELISHLKTVEIRLNYGIQINNPLMYEINSYYSNTFKLVSEAFLSLDYPLWNRMTPEELGFITLYVASSLERFKKPLKTLLITDLGRSLQSVLVQKINNNIFEINITQTCTINEINTLHLQDFELVLSTCSTNLPIDKPLLEINNILSDSDILLLKQAVNELYKLKNSPI